MTFLSDICAVVTGTLPEAEFLSPEANKKERKAEILLFNFQVLGVF